MSTVRDAYEVIGRFVENYRPLVLAVALLMVFVAFFGAGLVGFESGTETFVQKDSSLYQDYDHLFMKNFMTSNVFIIVSADDVTNPDILHEVAMLQEEVSRVPNVLAVYSIVDYVENINLKVNGKYQIPDDGINDILKLIPDDVKKMQLPNNQNLVMFVEVKPDMNDVERTDIVRNLNRVVEWASLSPSVSVTVTGEAPFSVEMEEEMNRTMGILLIISATLMVLALWLLFPVRFRLLPIFIVLIGIIYTFGVMGFVGIGMTMVTLSVFPILIGIGIDYAVQFHNRIEEELERREPKDAVVYTVGRLGPAVGIALLITSLGFFSLLTSSIPMVQDFGKLTIIGLISCYFTALFVGVLLVYSLDDWDVRKKRKNNRDTEHKSRAEDVIVGGIVRITSASARRPFLVFTIALLLSGTGIYYDQKVDVQTDVQTFVPEDMHALLEFEKIINLIGGSDQINVIVNGDIHDPDVLEWMYLFGKHEQQTHPDIKTVDSIATVLVEMNGGKIPQSSSEVDALLANVPDYTLNKLVKGNTIAVINFGIGDAYAEVGLEGVKELSKQLMLDYRWVGAPPGVSITVTGNMYMFTTVLDALTTGRVKTNFIGLILIFGGLLI
ncbi:MAG: hydrophobe/amphiphile efflux-3 (HAE3) family transporter, partial [Methermicoccaceae archaeon]